MINTWVLSFKPLTLREGNAAGGISIILWKTGLMSEWARVLHLRDQNLQGEMSYRQQMRSSQVCVQKGLEIYTEALWIHMGVMGEAGRKRRVSEIFFLFKFRHRRIENPPKDGQT
jgi:hypothetical protein